MFRFFIFVVFLFFSSPAFATLPSHCFTGEKIFFTCTLEDNRIVSLCGAPNMGKDVGYLQFRAGVPGHIEYEYPASQSSPAKVNFKFYHYFRYRTDYRRIAFTDTDADYQIFADYNGEDGEDQYASGLVFGGWDGAVTPCREPALNNLSPLDEILPETKEE